MEVADLSYLQAADLISSDERNGHDGVLSVHAECDPGSLEVAELVAHTRLYVFETRELDDGTRRVLIMLENGFAPLGWATAMTSDGIPLIYLYARPLYEVAKRPLKVRQSFEQTSRFAKQLAAGTRLHIMQTRRTVSGAQRVQVIVIGDTSETGWITAKHSDGRRTIQEVKGMAQSSGGCTEVSSTPNAKPKRAPSSPRSKYKSMSSEALETAAVEFLTQLGGIIPSTLLASAIEELERRAQAVQDWIEPLKVSVLEGGDKPLMVELGEVLQHRTKTVGQLMTEAAVSRTDSRQDGKIDKMEFRLWLRSLLDQQGMLSNMVGSNEIDNLFPTLDTDGNGTINESELDAALEQLENARKLHQATIATEIIRSDVYRKRIERIKGVVAWTVRSEDAVREREVALKKALGARLGDVVLEKQVPPEELAAMWTKDGPVDKARFRRESESLGWKADVADVDRLFDRLLVQAGSKQSLLDRMQLEDALSTLTTDAQLIKPRIRDLNIEIIETTKAVKTVQAEHKVQMQLEDEEEKVAEEESRRRKDARAAAKAKAAAAANEKPKKGKGKKGDTRKPAPRAQNAHQPG